jgi:hypothetical protein
MDSKSHIVQKVPFKRFQTVKQALGNVGSGRLRIG